jgi:hypothetical protein
MQSLLWQNTSFSLRLEKFVIYSRLYTMTISRLERLKKHVTISKCNQENEINPNGVTIAIGLARWDTNSADGITSIG